MNGPQTDPAARYCCAAPSGRIEHLVTLAGAQSPGMAVVPCPDHDPGRRWPGGILDLTIPDPD